ncbi:MAG: hypothetical protein WCX64_04640 [Candidatus Micrarchaeia archaeon]|jgi:hypothetical protein
MKTVVTEVEFMANANIELTGYTGSVVDRMISRGYAKTKTEAIRLAIYQFDQAHGLTEDEVFDKLTGKVLAQIDSGKMKMRKFNLSELD